jgi:hypothetical protein
MAGIDVKFIFMTVCIFALFDILNCKIDLTMNSTSLLAGTGSKVGITKGTASTIAV